MSYTAMLGTDDYFVYMVFDSKETFHHLLSIERMAGIGSAYKDCGWIESSVTPTELADKVVTMADIQPLFDAAEKAEEDEDLENLVYDLIDNKGFEDDEGKYEDEDDDIIVDDDSQLD